MLELYEHQRAGVDFLTRKQSAGLFWEMGLGKSRAALVAAKQLFDAGKIDRVLVLAPAAVGYSWREEIIKLELADVKLDVCFYIPKEQKVYSLAHAKSTCLPVMVVSYGLLQQERHVKALTQWAFDGECALIADESSFLKNRTAKQTKGAAKIAESCCYRWLLTGTPIANSPLDLYAQALVMSGGMGNGHNYNSRVSGPLKGFANFYHFRSRYAVTQPMRFGGGRTFQQVTGYQNLDELTRKFAPYVSRVEKKDALDLPAKSYSVREVALTEATWRIYQELKREAMLSLPNSEERPEPNAAVRILRLCQLTSGHVGTSQQMTDPEEFLENEGGSTGMLIGASRDVSSEKLDYLVESIIDGELANERALIVWCRWRRERERLRELLNNEHKYDGIVTEIFGGQSEKQRDVQIKMFMEKNDFRRVLLAQPHAGGYGLTLTAASTAVYLSNTFSHIDRVQSEDRTHRIGQKSNCLYIDVLATGPRGQRTVDHHVLETLREKKSLAEMTCSAWRKVLSDE